LQTLSISEFIHRLAGIPESDFTLDLVHEFVRAHPIEPDSLEPYLIFRTSHYTRNLLEKTKLYEVLAICWDVGQRSQIHNHRGQNCWMAVPIGKLLVQNYRLVSGTGETGPCELAESSCYWMDAARPGRVDPSEPIHFVANPPELAQRAVSIHIYSHPYDSCQVYFPEQQRSLEVPLHYTSKFGVLEAEEQGSDLPTSTGARK
jgi:cysteine dioxygenase